MPRKKIDYSETHFYKIVCRNTLIKDTYVGHTTDMKTRKGCHKRVCNNPNPNDKHHNTPVYQFIRTNEGWGNFDMIWLETKNCQNSMEARKRERELIEELNATLNRCNPYTSAEERKEYKDQWTEDNKEHTRLYKQNWHNENKDRVNSKKRQQYQDNPHHQIEKSKLIITTTLKKGEQQEIEFVFASAVRHTPIPTRKDAKEAKGIRTIYKP